MKILYTITKSDFGGAQRYVLELSSAMKERGYETAVASGGNGLLKDKVEEHSVTYLPIKNFQRDLNPLKDVLGFFEVIRIIRNYQPDIVHANSSKAGLLSVCAARILGIKRIIFTAHGWPFLERRSWWWKGLAWLGSYLTALLSHQVILVSGNDLKKTKMPGVKRKCTVIHNAVSPLDLLDRREAREELLGKDISESHAMDIWLVTNAELHPNKNQITAIDSVLSYNDQNRQKIFYCLIGKGGTYDELNQYVEERGATDSIKFLGYRDNVSRYLNAFDIFILPSKKEGLPYALLEAGAAEMPVIASRVGGIPEVVTDHKEGILIDPNQTESITSALNELISEPDLRTEYAAKLKQKIEAQFDQHKMLEQTQELYQLS